MDDLSLHKVEIAQFSQPAGSLSKCSQGVPSSKECSLSQDTILWNQDMTHSSSANALDSVQPQPDLPQPAAAYENRPQYDLGPIKPISVEVMPGTISTPQLDLPTGIQ
ncbi:hypothetical protein ElyMa_006272300 [Elysia marginata]|uniref:Uncharacterized protein n=1 Tax=Elysia marginata TaxID=1093978 RepID=A0AAV4HFL0_9GAST|nr:hypothetical protein ElyMa_006272300 [Elysia marginata]